MPDQIPDWLKDPAHGDVGLRTKAQHLGILRELLSRDYLRGTDWAFALRDLATMAREAVRASSAFVAILNPATGAWSAVTADGATLEDAEISTHGSKSALERMRKSWQPILALSGGQVALDSESLRAQDVDSVLAVPLLWWDVRRPAPERQLGGCLYAQRTADQPPFDDHDAGLLLDLARIAQPNLNLLRYLRDLETDLRASRHEIDALRGGAPGGRALEDYGSRDRTFGAAVLDRLRKYAQLPNATLLVTGPAGSGKTHLVRSFHASGPRRDGPFIVHDGRRGPGSKDAGDELFHGGPRGSLALLADRGTLCVEEIARLGRESQGRLLALLETGRVAGPGGHEVAVDVQVVACTREDLQRLVFQMSFREDLFRRLQEQTVEVPTLTERTSDIPELAATFLREGADWFGIQGIAGFTDAALQKLCAHDWSRHQNLRGLELAVHRAVLLAPPGTERVDAPHLELPTDPS